MTNNGIVGYLIHRDGCIEGQMGAGYNYILAANGLFIWAQNSLLEACIPVANCLVRGLTELETKCSLVHGKIPAVFFNMALKAMLAASEKEKYFALTWKDQYHLFETHQSGTGGGVEYNVLKDTVMDLHSHSGVLGPTFSMQDDQDELGFRLSLVVGHLNNSPTLLIRLGVYGSYCLLSWSDVFEGTLTGAEEYSFNKEKTEVVVHSESSHELVTDCGRRNWWNRIFGSRGPM